MNNAPVTLLNIDKTDKKISLVDHLSLIREEGKILGILGPNGAGKSNTIRMLITLSQPNQYVG